MYSKKNKLVINQTFLISLYLPNVRFFFFFLSLLQENNNWGIRIVNYDQIDKTSLWKIL